MALNLVRVSKILMLHVILLISQFVCGQNTGTTESWLNLLAGVFKKTYGYGGTTTSTPRPTQTYVPNQWKPPLTGSEQECRPTASRVRGYNGHVCAGQILFHEGFSSLREDMWQVQQYIPIYHPEYPFVSYQRLSDQPILPIPTDQNSAGAFNTNNGFLSIQPILQQTLEGFNNESIYSGALDLFRGCTAPAEACRLTASGADILPPIVAGRLTSIGFAFTYGLVHVRAKLPQGDWLYPEILLEPLSKKFGSQNFASGVLKIAAARGNAELFNGNADYSNKVLYGGPVMDFDCRNRLLTRKVLLDGRQWGDDYHVYSLRWEPDSITLFVDGEEWARVDPTANGLAGLLPQSCQKVPRALLALGSKLAPFDDYFYITFGLAVGGVTEFPEATITKNNHPKPWSNHNPKAKLHFWQDMDAWKKTWTEPELSIDYVQVVAL